MVGLEVVDGASYTRVVRHRSGHHRLACEFRGRHLAASAPTLSSGDAEQLARSLFDLDTDLRPFRRMARRDPILSAMVADRPELRRLPLLDPFEATVRAIAGQLVSVAAATTLVTRLVQRFGSPVRGGFRAFPTPEQLVRGRRSIARLGFPGGKVAAMVAVGREILSGRLDWTALSIDPELADRQLRSIPGIGPWTSAYVRWRALGDLDAFPETDLGIVHAFARQGIGRAAIGDHAARWRPWRGLAIGHLWASLSS